MPVAYACFRRLSCLLTYGREFAREQVGLMNPMRPVQTSGFANRLIIEVMDSMTLAERGISEVRRSNPKPLATRSQGFGR